MTWIPNRSGILMEYNGLRQSVHRVRKALPVQPVPMVQQVRKDLLDQQVQ
jgi:hypothetical protein